MIRKGIHPTTIIDFQGRLELPESTVIEPHCVFYGGPSASLLLGANNIFYPSCVVRIEFGEMRTGVETSFGPGCIIYEPRGGLAIGSHCLIGGGVMFSGVHHGSEKLDVPMRRQTPLIGSIVIEDDVWIGMGAKILPGVVIGRGSIIGAGSVVAKSIPAYSVAMGIPCKVKRKRNERHDQGE
jgi:acetyltransferase-like isoleucine patch superfamily enzyme